MKQPITAPAFTLEAVDWQQQVPFSQRYGDRYHTASGARAQAMHVFLGGCGLPAAWQPAGAGHAPDPAGDDDERGDASRDATTGQPAGTPDCPEAWIILETGFGLGLNFLSTWAAWRATADRRPARLHFVSTEAHPVRADDLRRACRQTDPALQVLGERLASRWPLGNAFDSAPNRDGDGKAPVSAHLPDRISLDFDDDAIHLEILLGDAREQLDARLQREGPLGAHSVFLDGFDPHKNPVIWSPETLRAVARHCCPNARLATWSVARSVRDALQAAGFQVWKRPGLPPKRDCLAATLTGFDPSAPPQALAATDAR